jgi:hypothetical protein
VSLFTHKKIYSRVSTCDICPVYINLTEAENVTGWFDFIHDNGSGDVSS